MVLVGEFDSSKTPASAGLFLDLNTPIMFPGGTFSPPSDGSKVSDSHLDFIRVPYVFFLPYAFHAVENILT